MARVCNLCIREAETPKPKPVKRPSVRTSRRKKRVKSPSNGVPARIPGNSTVCGGGQTDHDPLGVVAANNDVRAARNQERARLDAAAKGPKISDTPALTAPPAVSEANAAERALAADLERICCHYQKMLHGTEEADSLDGWSTMESHSINSSILDSTDKYVFC